MISESTVSRHSGLTPAGGPKFRRSTVGPEYDLLIECLAGVRGRADGSLQLSCFIEPKIDGGYPDAVLAYWDPSVARLWPACRTKLTSDDFRLLQLLLLGGPSDATTLGERFGAPVQRSLGRLSDAAVIEADGIIVRARPIEDIFAVRRLVAIEAKTSGASAGLMQAVRNSWFASESFYLTGTRASSHLVGEAERLGVGLLGPAGDIDDPRLFPVRRRLPVSYVSWLFNDWAWRATL